MVALTPTQQRIAAFARQKIGEGLLYLDTETTGLDRYAEIIEIAVIGSQGETLFESYVRPSVPIPPEVTLIHGITDVMVEKAPRWPLVWPQLKPILSGKVVCIYNADYDLRLMQQSMERYRLSWKENIQSIDVMQLYAEFRGEWDPNRRSYRRFKLEEAGRFFRIPIPNSHRASDDSRLTRALLHCIAGLPY